jgi:hypothetical protein
MQPTAGLVRMPLEPHKKAMTIEGSEKRAPNQCAAANSQST